MLPSKWLPILLLGVAVIWLAVGEPCSGQWRGRSRFQRPPTQSVDPAVVLHRLDTNRDGLLAPGEIPQQARPIVDRAAQQAELNLDEPVAIDKLVAAIRELRAGGSGSGGSGGGQPGPSGSGKSDESASAVPGFGVDAELTPVPGFGPVGDANVGGIIKLADRYESRVIEYVDRIFSRYDTNRNDILDQEEWKNVRWRSDPKESDTNSDGRLSKAEFCERMVGHWNWGRKQPAARTAATGGSSPSGFGSKSSGGATSQSGAGESNSKVRKYAESLLKQYDQNKNGVLEKDEWSKMSGNRKTADKNKDDVLTLDELTVALGSYGKSSSGTAASPSTSRSSRSSSYAGGRRTTSGAPVYRFKSPTERLPRGLPDWFTRSDTDGDGQIAMSEYSATWSDSKAQEFAKYDLNGDGFVTPQECLLAEKED